jgi:hypothetical protein
MNEARRVRTVRARGFLMATLFLLVMGACADTPPGEDDTLTSDGGVTITQASETLPIPFITNESLRGLATEASGEQASLQLAAQAGGGLMGWNSPIAVPSPDGRYVAYNAWTQLVAYDPAHSASSQGIKQGDPFATPSIRIVDTSTGEDLLLEEGAFSVAWSANGSIAYFKGFERDYPWMGPYQGQVMVRSSLEAKPVAWLTDPGEYIVHSWAGEHLLVYGDSGVIALDAPGQPRVIAEQAGIVALSPDGSRILVTNQPGFPIRLIEVSTGELLSELDVTAALKTPSGGQVVVVNHAGSWEGDSVAAQATLDPAGSAILMLKVDGDTMSVAQLLEFPPEAFPMGVSEPQIVDPSGSRVVAWAPIKGSGGEAKGVLYTYLDCNVAEQSCGQSPPFGDLLFHPLYNPSRPLAGAS